MEFYNTWKTQLELLPRIAIIYGKGFEGEDYEIISNGFSVEWLWFGIFFKLN